MKKKAFVLIGLGLMLFLEGCSPGDFVDLYLSEKETESTEDITPRTRVYMDEIRGILQDFDGVTLTMESNEEAYVFDVSQATLECQEGMITGDEISVIYEGQLSDTDTSTVKALKVVDEFHKKVTLEDQVVHGTIQNLTANTITLQSDDNHISTYPITGTEQYYQSGVQTGTPVYLHYKGKYQESEDGSVQNASHLKVLSISDQEPFVAPVPTPTPAPSEETSSSTVQEKQFRATIQDLQLNLLRVMPDGGDTALSIDISALPCYFCGGAAPGSWVTVSYTGEFTGNSLTDISLLSVIGDNPEGINERYMNFAVTGTIIGSTSNTITLQTSDGALVTCNIENADNLSTGGLLTGCGVKVTFNPAASRTSNIYTALKIEDA
jgi:hypothetical protein